MPDASRANRTKTETHRPEILAHRGAAIDAPENTMAAFRQALEHGATGIETDVRVSADGVAYLFHDADLERITGIEGEADALSIAELKALDAGAHHAPQFRGERIPTLVELAAICRDSGHLILDLKVEGTARAIAEALTEAQMPPDRVSICTWTASQRREIQTVLPDAELVYIDDRSHEAEADGWFASRLEEGFGGLSLAWEGLDQGMIDAAHRHGMTVLVWTVNAPEELRRALGSGVDGIITDDPGGLFALASP